MSMTLAAAFRRTAGELKKQARMVEYREDPVLWIKERAGITLWSKQKEIAESLRDNRYTVVKSCHAVGKSFLGALLVCWWIDVHPSTDTVVVTTAPSSDQVRKVMWEYIRKMHKQFGLRGTVSEQAEWKDDNRNVVGYGRKPSDTNMNVIQGEHKLYTLVLIDEAGGVPPNIWVGADAITTMETNRILAIGNPDSPNTKFGQIFLEPDKYPEWSRFSISAFESPNFTDEGKDLPQDMLDKLVSREWAETQKMQWGPDSALYKGRVLAEFPETSFDALFGSTNLSACRDVEIMPSTQSRPVLGVDIARFGGDVSVVISNTDGIVKIEDAWSGSDVITTAKRIDDLARRIGASEIRVDGTGVGAGVVDYLSQVRQNTYVVVEVIAAAKSPDVRRWGNYRAYLYDNLRSLVNSHSIRLPALDANDEKSMTLNDELLSMRFNTKPGTNVMMIESKDSMRRRGVKSPDYADALTYACADFNSQAEYQDGGEYSKDAIEFMGDELLAGFAISPV